MTQDPSRSTPAPRTEPNFTRVYTHMTGLIGRHVDQPSRIEPDTPFSTLEIDSLAVFEIVFELEEHWSIELPDDAIPLFSSGTVRDAVKLVQDTITH